MAEEEETRPQSDRIPKSKLAAALEGMRGKKRKETDDVSALAAVKQMRRQIERLLKLEYTYDEISALLEQYEIFISASRLKYFLTEVKKTIRHKNSHGAGSKASVVAPPVVSAHNGVDAKEQQSIESVTNTKNERGTAKTKAPSQGKKSATEVSSTPQPEAHSFNPLLVNNDDL